MTDIQLYKRLQYLKPSLRSEVYDFIDFLLMKQGKENKPKKPKFESMELVHRDPFDRILVAQAIVENMTIITRDENIQKYSIKTNW